MMLPSLWARAFKLHANTRQCSVFSNGFPLRSCCRLHECKVHGPNYVSEITRWCSTSQFHQQSLQVLTHRRVEEHNDQVKLLTSRLRRAVRVEEHNDQVKLLTSRLRR